MWRDRGLLGRGGRGEDHLEAHRRPVVGVDVDGPGHPDHAAGAQRLGALDLGEPALEEALREDSEAIVERYIKGTEVTCGLMKTSEGFTVFPVTEIIPKKQSEYRKRLATLLR